MQTPTLSKVRNRVPAAFNDFFKPWNEWFDNGGLLSGYTDMPAVNITENKDAYNVSLAAPGLKKNDFNIDIDGNMLTISSEKEESKEDKDKKFTRREYSYSSFSRSFTLPDEINKEKIEATYTDGVLHIVLPRKAEAQHSTAKHIAVK
ncbi:MAG TPA: Hsp20/alpha crystallin family protein [Chitinophagaceae bacterium]|nr:Hsp20/alpha crystallin family protein [Chitinophagaceae bacterium]